MGIGMEIGKKMQTLGVGIGIEENCIGPALVNIARSVKPVKLKVDIRDALKQSLSMFLEPHGGFVAGRPATPWPIGRLRYVVGTAWSDQPV